MNRLKGLSNKYIALGISVLLILIIIVYYYFNNKTIVIDGRLSSSDPQFKEALESQVSDTTEILNVVKEDEGLGDSEYAKNESKDRIVMPYKDSKSNKPLGILILEKQNNKWVEVQDIKMIGDSFDEIRLKDLDKDGEDEVVIGISMSRNTTNGVIVFKRNRMGYREIFTDNYERMFVDSFNETCCPLLILTKKDPNTNTLSLNAYNFSNEHDVKTSKVVLGDIDDKVSVKVGKLDNDKKAFFLQKRVEDKKGEISIYTLEEGALYPVPLLDDKDKVENSRYVEIRDINGDKTLDIPVLIETKSGSNMDIGNKPLITNWLSMNKNGRFSNIQKEYTSEDNEFTFKIPNIWGENLDVKERRAEDSDKNIVMFDSYDDQENYTNIITIEIYSLAEWQRIPLEERGEKNVIFKSGSRVYTLANSNGEEATDLKSVKSNFRIYNPQQ